MRRFAALLIMLTISFALVGVAVRPAAAQSSPLTDDQKKAIVANCSSIKSSITQLKISDTSLRVNRGQTYESFANKLMDPFNSRVSANKLDARAMETVTTSYRSTLNNFRLHFISYDKKMSDTLAIDCGNDPQRFHDSVEEARSLRQQAHADIVKLNQYIDDYRQAVGDFQLNFERASQ